MGKMQVCYLIFWVGLLFKIHFQRFLLILLLRNDIMYEEFANSINW